MKYHNGVWSYKGKTYTSLYEALVANWPKEEHRDKSIGRKIVHTVNGYTFPVVGVLHVEGRPIPLLNIRMMSDERERELARKGAAV